MGKYIKTNLSEYIIENKTIPNIWYHGSDKPVEKFLFSLIGVNSNRISNYHGYGIYFINDINRAKKYGNIITTVEIDTDADLLSERISPKQLQKIHKQLASEIIDFEDDDWFNNPTYGEYSVLTDVEEFYDFLRRKYRENFKDNKDTSEFLLRCGIDGMRVINDVGDVILVIFNEDVITIIEKPIQEQKEAETKLNNNFRKWFNGSKVIDKKGNPKIVYHGSPEDFDIFRKDTYFTDDYFNADGYAGEDGIVFEVYLSLKNPLIIDCDSKKWDDIETPYGTTTQEVVSNVDRNKYDGIIFENIKDSWIDDVDYQDASTVYVNFNSYQVKSVDNDGEWSLSDMNIFS